MSPPPCPVCGLEPTPGGIPVCNCADRTTRAPEATPATGPPRSSATDARPGGAASGRDGDGWDGGPPTDEFEPLRIRPYVSLPDDDQDDGDGKATSGSDGTGGSGGSGGSGVLGVRYGADADTNSGLAASKDPSASSGPSDPAPDPTGSAAPAETTDAPDAPDTTAATAATAVSAAAASAVTSASTPSTPSTAGGSGTAPGEATSDGVATTAVLDPVVLRAGSRNTSRSLVGADGPGGPDGPDGRVSSPSPRDSTAPGRPRASGKGRRRRRLALAAVLGTAAAVAVVAIVASGLFSYEKPRREDTLPDHGLSTSAPATGGTKESAPASGTASTSAGPSSSSSASATAGTAGTGGKGTSPKTVGTAGTSGSPASGQATAQATGTVAPAPPAGEKAPASLHNGDHGPEVKELQLRLKQLLLYTGTADGEFGDKVENAVNTYQLTRGIGEDPHGVYGPATRTKLESQTDEP